MHQYWAYGLLVESEIVFPELLPYQFEKADVTIQLGKTPTKLDSEGVVHKVYASMSPTEYLLQLLDVAKYYVTNGNTIVVESLASSDIKTVRLFILSNAFAAILHQRNTIPLHASGIFHKDGVVLFCGNSGAGKSTLLLGLQQKGYSIFTDDVCVLQYQPNGSMQVVSSYPMIKLWEDSFKKVGIEKSIEQERIREELPKYAQFYHQQFRVEPQTVTQLFVLNNNHNEDAIAIKQLSPLEAFDIVEKNTYRPLQTKIMKKRGEHFKQVAALLNGLPVFHVNRPPHKDTQDILIANIENTFL